MKRNSSPLSYFAFVLIVFNLTTFENIPLIFLKNFPSISHNFIFIPLINFDYLICCISTRSLRNLGGSFGKNRQKKIVKKRE